MYAYMLWADTTAGIMKMRNGANSAWISLWELDGTFIATDISLSAGTAGAPSLFFTGDTNTGIYSPGADQVAISTAGSGRLFIDSSGRVGVGTSSPTALLTVSSGEARLDLNATNASGRLWNIYSGGGGNVGAGAFAIAEGGTTQRLVIVGGGSGEALRIDASNRVGIGTSSPQDILHVKTDGNTGLEIGSAGAGIGSRIISYDRTAGVPKPQVIASETFSVQTSTTGGGLTSRLHVTSAGLIGIGTTSPGSALEVSAAVPVITVNSGAANPSSIEFKQAGTLYGRVRFDGNNFDIGNLYAGGATIINAGNAERARIDSSGRLLVGTSTSSVAASIVCQGTSAGSSGAAQLWLQRGQAASGIGSGDTLGRINFADNAGNLFAWIDGQTDGAAGTNDYPGRLVFSVSRDGSASPVERMRIRESGEIGTFGAGDGIGASTAVGAGTANHLFIGQHSASAVLGGTISFRVWTNGNVVNTNNSYGAISDAKLKENIVDAGPQWDDLKALRVRKYNLKKETGQQTHTQIGLVAQEAELVSPGLVSEAPDRDAEGNDLGTVTKSVNYSVLYMKAVKALQEAMERIESLEAKVAALEGE
jgi:hypothetical protein